MAPVPTSGALALVAFILVGGCLGGGVPWTGAPHCVESTPTEDALNRARQEAPYVLTADPRNATDRYLDFHGDSLREGPCALQVLLESAALQESAASIRLLNTTASSVDDFLIEKWEEKYPNASPSSRVVRYEGRYFVVGVLTTS